MSRRNREDDAAYMELTPDAWHQTDEGNYVIDCPECGSAASLMNVVKHGRCNGFLDQREEYTELDEERMDCTAKLWFELGYVSDPEPQPRDQAADEPLSETASEDGTVQSASRNEDSGDHEQPAGADGTVDTGKSEESDKEESR